MSSIELRLFLEERFKTQNFKTDCLNVIVKEDINGKIFLTMNEEDLKNIFIEATFGIRRYLTILIAELSHPIPEYPVYLRKFDSQVSHTDKYHIGHCADVSVNSRGRRTDPIRNFHLVEDTDVTAALELITSEVISFISACLNDRRNGTIYFGISPNSDQKFQVGEIVGVSLTKMEVQAEIQEAITGSFTKCQEDMVRYINRFVPVIGTEKNLFVIEVDVVPSSALLLKDIVKTKERYLPMRFIKYHKGKDSVVFRFSDEGFPKIISTEELCQYEQVLPRITEERKEDELQIHNYSNVEENLRTKLLNRLFGGQDNLKDTRYFFVMTGPLDDHMTEDKLRKNLSFILNLHPKVVFDFNGDKARLQKNLEDHCKYMPRILTTNDFDENMTEKEAYEKLISSLELEIKTSWIFCNGCKELSIPVMEPYQWNKETSTTFQRILKCFMDFVEPERTYVVICLFSQNYLTMIEACDELLRKRPEQKWIVLAETEDIAKLWQEQLLVRHIINARHISDNCVTGLPWEHVNSIILNADKSNKHEIIFIPCSTGAIVEVDMLHHWSDITVVSANDALLVSAHDTLPVSAYDTLPVSANDTLPVSANDTLLVSANETLPVSTNDTLPVSTNDTLPVAFNDTLPVSANNILLVSANDTLPASANDTLPVSANDTLPVSANDNLPEEELETIMETEQERFYRGDEVNWLNFAFREQVLKRDVHDPLMEITLNSLDGRVTNETEIVNSVEVIHQPGAGGTTVAKHILWDLRKRYRCCVVKRFTNQTCDQLDELRFYKDHKPRPILILIDNVEDFEQLKTSLIEKGRQRMQREKESFKIYCTLLLCIRCETLPPQLSNNQVLLRQELTESERYWFKRKYQILKHENKENNKINPEFLIAFNVLRKNFNKKYISKVVSAFTTSIKSDKEILLLRKVAFLNTYDPQFLEIPVSCFDYIFHDSASAQEGRQFLYWEANLSDGVKVLLNVSSHQIIYTLKVFHKVIAGEILIKLKEIKEQKNSEIMSELLTFDKNGHITEDYKTLKKIIRNIFIMRESNAQGQGRKIFSDFILNVESDEGEQIVCGLLEHYCSQCEDPYVDQLLARYYMHIKQWDQAEKYAQRARDRVPDNSCLWHTYGQVFKSQIDTKSKTGLNNVELCKQINLAILSINAFSQGQIVYEAEKISTKDKNNLAPYFGELETIDTLLGYLKSSPQFKNREELHKYLVDQDYHPPELHFFSQVEKDFLKGLESSTKEAMRHLDDEVLHHKEKIDATRNDHQELNRKTLVKLKASLDVYFGETANEIPEGLGARDSNDYRLRQARTLGGFSLYSLLELRKQGKKHELINIFDLIRENLKSDQRNFDDLISMLRIVTVCILDEKEISGITYQVLLEWSKDIFVLGKQKKTRPHLEMYLYYVLYNFPTQERCSFKLITEADLLDAIINWKKALRENNQKNHSFEMLFILGNGKPLYDIIFNDTTEVHKMFTPMNEQPQNDLRIFTGTLTEGGKEVSLQIDTKRNSTRVLKIPTAYPVYKNTMYNRRIHFYIGFSLSGPKAFAMCLENTQIQDPAKH